MDTVTSIASSLGLAYDFSPFQTDHDTNTTAVRGTVFIIQCDCPGAKCPGDVVFPWEDFENVTAAAVRIRDWHRPLIRSANVTVRVLQD